MVLVSLPGILPHTEVSVHFRMLFFLPYTTVSSVNHAEVGTDTSVHFSIEIACFFIRTFPYLKNLWQAIRPMFYAQIGKFAGVFFTSVYFRIKSLTCGVGEGILLTVISSIRNELERDDFNALAGMVAVLLMVLLLSLTSWPALRTGHGAPKQSNKPFLLIR